MVSMSPADTIQNERYIERQIERTGWKLRLQDLVTGLMLMATTTIGVLACAILIDHWLIPLNTAARLMTLLGLLICWCYLGWRKIAPSIVHRINPVYAAHTIEAGAPELKNSLLNFLFLRRQPETVRPVVYEAVRQRAATDLTTISLETTIDRSRLIRIGYLLAAAVLLAGFYKIVSPKDPWQTVRRVVAPWSDIARPSRVTISNVRVDDVPLNGNIPTTIFQGQHVRVSATVHGLLKEEMTLLVYRSEDEQWTEEPIVMQSVDSLDKYTCEFPQHDGLQHNIIFRIQAGDTVSREFRLNLSTAPFISVEAVTYTYPDYTTRDTVRTVDQGDIRGLEGTRVTIHARANQPIESAYVHFLSTTNQSTSDRGRKYLRMQVADEQADVSFYLTLVPNHGRTQRNSYELRFSNNQKKQNQRPVQHLLEVIPDLDPVINILTPQKSEIEIAENGKQKIEILARDPDFGLRRVELHMVTGGEPLQTITLLDDETGRKGPIRRNTIFIPRQHGLRSGQSITYWAIAQDNRTDARTSSPAPNVARTTEFVIKIGPPDRHIPEPTTDRPNNQKQPTDPPQTGDGASQNAGDQSDSTDEKEVEAAAEPTDPANEGSAGGGQNNQQGKAQDSDSASSAEENEQRGGTSESRSARTDSDSGSGPDATSGERQPRPNDGTEDGEVFEEILKRIRKSQTGNASQHKSNSPSTQTPQQPNESKATGQENSNTDGQDAAPHHESEANRSSSASKSTNNQKNAVSGKESQSTPGAGKNSDGSDTFPDKVSDQQFPPDAKQDPVPASRNGVSPDTDRERNQQHRSQTTQEKNKKNLDTSRSSDSPKDKSLTEPKSPSKKNRQSDSQDSQEENSIGDRQQNGDKNTNQTGNNNSDRHPVAGATSQSESGATSERANSKQTTTGKTDQATSERKSGTKPKDGTSQTPTGSQGAADAESQSGPSEGKQNEQSNPNPNSLGSFGQHSSEDNPKAGGMPGTKASQTTAGKPIQEPGGDAANLEHTLQATDLALRYLREQQDNPDRALLDDLGWTQDDLLKFQQRWERLRKDAQQNTSAGQKAQQELKDRLESLGLQSPRTKLRRGSSQIDGFGGLSDGGQKTQPPAEYRELFKAFQKSTAVD